MDDAKLLDRLEVLEEQLYALRELVAKNYDDFQREKRIVENSLRSMSSDLFDIDVKASKRG